MIAWATRLRVTTTGGQYRGGVVVSANLQFCCLFGQLVPTAGKTVSFYRMASPTSTNLGAATLVGTAVTGADGSASVLYRMNTLAVPPAGGTSVAFAAVFAGTTDMTYGPSQSATVARPVTPRATVSTLAATRSGATLSGTVTLKQADLSYATVSNGVTTNTTITGSAIPNTPVTVQWLKANNGFVGSFATTTGANGIAHFSKSIPAQAARVRAVYGPNSAYGQSISNIVAF